jgi:hypothetical protein
MKIFSNPLHLNEFLFRRTKKRKNSSYKSAVDAIYEFLFRVHKTSVYDFMDYFPIPFL